MYHRSGSWYNTSLTPRRKEQGRRGGGEIYCPCHHEKSFTFHPQTLYQICTSSYVLIGSNSLTALGVRAIANSLGQNQSLLTLDLGYDEIDPAGARSIAGALLQNESLLALDLSIYLHVLSP